MWAGCVRVGKDEVVVVWGRVVTAVAVVVVVVVTVAVELEEEDCGGQAAGWWQCWRWRAEGLCGGREEGRKRVQCRSTMTTTFSRSVTTIAAPRRPMRVTSLPHADNPNQFGQLLV